MKQSQSADRKSVTFVRNWKMEFSSSVPVVRNLSRKRYGGGIFQRRFIRFPRKGPWRAHPFGNVPRRPLDLSKIKYANCILHGKLPWHLQKAVKLENIIPTGKKKRDLSGAYFFPYIFFEIGSSQWI
ncbi:hypothetical protein PUN28_013283 [Cardiocondyla obscurior]|uniref:Uncharacterized protein n=1 Tax=Cardiocondyla obscurior TaxID=286306 RepID=A0AAW2F7T6_9HYME